MKCVVALLALVCVLIGCDGAGTEGGRAVMLYTSVDEPYVRPLIEQFTRQTGIAVQLQTDTEATKSIGLAERLRSEKANPRCDVWWGNEVFHTVRLADEGLLSPYESAVAKDVRGQYRDAQHRWTGVGVRARVIGVTPSARDKIRGLDDLTDPQYKGRVCLARPTAGTTSGHVAALYVLWGNDRADAFFKALAANDAKLLGGNSDVARQIAAGNFIAGLTDNDDIDATRAAGGAINSVLPDATTIGTLAIPTTVALVRRDDLHPDAQKLIDYLLSSEVEQALIAAKFAGWSVRSSDAELRAMKVDYAEVARVMPEAVQRVAKILGQR